MTDSRACFDTRYGCITILKNDSVISRSIETYGEWAQHELEILRQLIKSGDTVLDIGAFIGTHTLALSRFVGENGCVLAFEPRKEYFSILSENVRQNGLGNVQLHNLGLAEKERSIAVTPIDFEVIGNFGATALEDLTAASSEHVEYLNLARLDDVVQDKHIDFLKVDVEGMEALVFKGGLETVSRSRPVVFAECNSVEGSVFVLQIFRSRNYLAKGILTPAYNSNNYRRNNNNIFGPASEVGIVFIPKEKAGLYAAFLEQNELAELLFADDLVYLLLNKPQYPFEVLAKTAAAKTLEPGFSADRFRQIGELNELLMEREAQLEGMSARLERLEKELAYAQAIVMERDTQLTTVNLQLDRLGKELAYAQAIVAERDAQLAAMSTEIARREGEYEHARAVVTQHDSQLTAISFEFDRLVKDLAVAHQDLIEREAQFREINEELEHAGNHIAEDRRALNERDQRLHEIFLSTSWRITAPVRWLGTQTKRFKLFGKIGLARVLTKLHSTYLRDVSRNPESNPSWPCSTSTDGTATAQPGSHQITVIVPIFRNVAMTKICIESAIGDIVGKFNRKLLLINDASPEPAMPAMLALLAAQWPDQITVLTNEQNLGFVLTVNHGFAVAKGSDVVLLNSDVRVAGNWLTRLEEAAYAEPRIATVTPFSNNATICSFPRFLKENPLFLGLDEQTIDRAFSRSRLPLVEVPTGVGFCMYMRADCINEIGNFSFEKFGRGYGEENDFCQRAIQAGWKNMVISNVFAFHHGAASFSGEKTQLAQTAMSTLADLHPNYHLDVQKFISKDPLFAQRQTRICDVLNELGKPVILAIGHSLGGGVSQHIKELAEHFRGRAVFVVLTPADDKGEQVSLKLAFLESSESLQFSLASDLEPLLAVLRYIRVAFVHFHHSLGFDKRVLNIPQVVGVPYLVTIHDFYWLSGNPTLTDDEGIFRPESWQTSRNSLYPLPASTSFRQWQDQFKPFLEGADRIIFPSSSTRMLFGETYHFRAATVAGHLEDKRRTNLPHVSVTMGNPMQIGVLGALSREKGADLLEQIALQAKHDGLPFKFILLGYAYRPLGGVFTTGAYEEGSLGEMIERNRLDLIFFPARWPETYSYTLSSALESQRPIFAPNLGAFPERLRGRAGVCLFNHLESAQKILAQLMQFIAQLQQSAKVEAVAVPEQHHNYYESDYLTTAGSAITGAQTDSESIFALINAIKKKCPPENRSKIQGALLRHLWLVYQSPRLRSLTALIPYQWTRKIKRCLSKRPIHEVLKDGMH